MVMPLILIILLSLNHERNNEWKTIPYLTIGELTSSSLIIEGEVSRIDSQLIYVEVQEILKGSVKSKEIKIANNFFDNYGLERKRNKGMGFWDLGDRKLFFLRIPHYEGELLKENIFRVANQHDDSERKIISENGKNYIELSYGSWVNSELSDKYQKLRKKESSNRKISYDYSEMKEAIIYFSSKKKKIQRKVKKTTKRNQHINSFGRTQWNGVITDKWLKNIQKMNSSNERLLDEYFDNVYKETW